MALMHAPIQGGNVAIILGRQQQRIERNPRPSAAVNFVGNWRGIGRMKPIESRFRPKLRGVLVCNKNPKRSLLLNLIATLPNDPETLRIERPSTHVLRVLLHRPEVSNSLNTQMGAELKQLWDALYVDQQDIRCVILTGTGEKAFCGGGDLKQRNNMTDLQWQQQHALFELGMIAMMNCPIPIIAAVNGAAFGGGCEFVAAADFAYAASHARFALTETTLGIMPGAMGTQNLPRAVGERRAKEIILTGLPFSADEALAWGLVNRVFPLADLQAETLKTAERIAGNAPISTRQAKKSISMASQTDLHIGYRYEIEAYNRMVPTQDRLEGVRAFNEKRKADFKGQ